MRKRRCCTTRASDPENLRQPKEPPSLFSVPKSENLGEASRGGFKGRGPPLQTACKMLCVWALLGRGSLNCVILEKASVARTTEGYLPSCCVERQIEAHSSHAFTHSSDILECLSAEATVGNRTEEPAGTMLIVTGREGGVGHAQAINM